MSPAYRHLASPAGASPLSAIGVGPHDPAASASAFPADIPSTLIRASSVPSPLTATTPSVPVGSSTTKKAPGVPVAAATPLASLATPGAKCWTWTSEVVGVGLAVTAVAGGVGVCGAGSPVPVPSTGPAGSAARTADPDAALSVQPQPAAPSRTCSASATDGIRPPRTDSTPTAPFPRWLTHPRRLYDARRAKVESTSRGCHAVVPSRGGSGARSDRVAAVSEIEPAYRAPTHVGRHRAEQAVSSE